jgi:hypothetical protein
MYHIWYTPEIVPKEERRLTRHITEIESATGLGVVSNTLMGRFRRLLKLPVLVFLSVCIVALFMWLGNQFEQRIYRQRVQILLSEVQTVQLRKTTWDGAQALFRRWGDNRRYGPHCDSTQCSLEITLDNAAYHFIASRNVLVKLDDYFRWKFKLSYDIGPFARAEFWLFRLYMRAGGHPARVVADVGMRNGVVWSKGILVSIETHAHPAGQPGNWVGDYGLVADIHSLSRLGYFGNPSPTPQLISHPDYEIGQPGGCEVCVMGWVKFTPYAAPRDIDRLMQLNLTCLTRWHPCTTQSDIMPAAWSQYLEEHSERSRLEGPGCSPVLVEILGRDSSYAAAGEVVRFHKTGSGDTVAIVRVLDQMKNAGGAIAWHARELRSMSLLLDTPCAPEKLSTGMRLIFFGGFDRSNKRFMPDSAPWPVMQMTGANLALFSRGAAQDYAAMVQSPGRN